MSQMGILFDNVLRTGTRVLPLVHDEKGARVRADEESSIFSVAVQAPRQQGIMLFLVRELSGTENDSAESYLRRGFRFADPRWFSPVLADRAGVAKLEIDGLLEHLKLYAKRGTKPCVRSGGSYVGFFAVRPSISRQGGVDTLVYQFARHQIPAYRLPDVEHITDDMRAWILSVSGRSMKELGELCLREVNKNMPIPDGPRAEDMWIFKSSLILAMDAMITNLPMFQNLAERSFISAEIVEVPSSDDDSTSTASMLVFHAAFPAPLRHGYELPGLAVPHEVSGSYQKRDTNPTFTFVPYTLFTKSQMMLLRGSAARKFSKECRQELMKRYAVPAEALHQYVTSPQDRLALPQMCDHASLASGLANIKHYPEVHEEVDEVTADLVLRYGSFSNFAETPAQLEAKTARSRCSVLSSLTGESTQSSSPHTILFHDSLPPRPPMPSFQPHFPAIEQAVNPAQQSEWRSTEGSSAYTDEAGNLICVVPDDLAAPLSPGWRGLEHDGIAAPAYSPTRAPHLLGSPIRPSVGGILKHTQNLRNSLLPPNRRPHTATNPTTTTPTGALQRVVRPSTASAVASGSRNPLTEPVIDVGYFVPAPPPMMRNYGYSYNPSQSVYTDVPVTSQSPPRPLAQPLAITARLRSDDWPSRCMDGLERSPAGQELLGIDW